MSFARSLLFAALVFPLAVPARADLVPVTDPSIRLLGKGMADRREHHALALACVDDKSAATAPSACQRHRFLVAVASNRQLYWIGPEFTLAEGETMKEHLRAIGKESRKYIPASRQIILYAGTVVAGVAIIATAGSTAGVTAAGVPKGMILAAAGLGILVAPFLISMYTHGQRTGWHDYGMVSEYMLGDVANAKSVRDQSGWNWEDRPRKINHGYFERLLRAIDETGYQTYRAGRPGPRQD